MSVVLDQSEIDALLASVQADAQRQAGVQHGVPSVVEPTRVVEVQPYDFRRPRRVSNDQIRALAMVHEIFARNFGVTLSGFLRTIIDVRVASVQQLAYNEFIHSLPNPTGFVILQAPPLEGQMCLEISPLIIYPIIERLLGGHTRNLFIPQRPLTSIEWRLILRIVGGALDHLSEVWRNLVDARFEVHATESNPQLVHIVAPSEVVVFISFEIKIWDNVGTMSLCIPFNTIESVLAHLTSQSWFYKPKVATTVQQQRILRNLEKSRVPLTAYLGRATIRLSDLRRLRSGDILQLDKPCDQDLIVRINDRNKFAARPGQHRGKRAIRLVRAASSDEPL